MMAILWNDVMADIGIAKRHFAEAVAIADEDFPGFTPTYRSVMAFQHAMQAGYTSLEAAIKRLLTMLDEALPVGPDQHAVLLRRAVHAVPGQRPAIFTEEVFKHLDELRRFRHIAMHSYDDFDARRVVVPVASARVVLGTIDAELARFRAAIDP